MGQIQFTISLIMIGLFSIAIIGFALEFAEDNNAAIDLNDDSQFSQLYKNQTGNLEAFSNDTQTTYSSIVNSSISESGQTTARGGQFAITPVNAILSVKDILRVGYTSIFGSGKGFGLFLTTFLGMITFIMGLLIWKTWAGRLPD